MKQLYITILINVYTVNNLWMPCGRRDSMGPGTLCCSACNWTNGSLRNKIQRNYKGLKMTVCTGSWGKLRTKGFKKTKQPNCYFWRPRSKNWVLGAKAGYCACPLYSILPKGWAHYLSHPSSQTSGHTPILTPHREPACSSWMGELAREPVAYFCSLLLQQGPQ